MWLLVAFLQLPRTQGMWDPCGSFFFFFFFELLIFPFSSQRASIKREWVSAALEECQYDWSEQEKCVRVCVCAVRSTTMALQPCCSMGIHMIHYYPWHAPLCVSVREDGVTEMKRQTERETGVRGRETIRGGRQKYTSVEETDRGWEAEGDRVRGRVRLKESKIAEGKWRGRNGCALQ